MRNLPEEPPGAEITSEALYLRRRDFLKNTALFAGTAAAVGAVVAGYFVVLTALQWWRRRDRPAAPEACSRPAREARESVRSACCAGLA